MRLRRFAIAAALAFLAAHAAVVLLLHSPALVSNILLCIPATVAALLCWWQCHRARNFMQIRWRLLALGIAVWLTGQIIYTYCECILKQPQTTALPSDFYFFLWGVPVLLAIASSDSDGVSRSLLILDGVQALLAIALVYFQLFAVRNGGGPGPMMGTVSLMHLYTVESLVLASAASLRLLARPLRRERSFYHTFCLFLWTYAAVSIPANYLEVVFTLPAGNLSDVFWDLPFLLLVYRCIASRSERSIGKPAEEAPATATALIVANACPAFFTIAILILAAHICVHRFYLGALAMLLALTSYTLRAALLQTRYMQAQRALAASERALLQANNRLQEISLADPLTGVANRRRFEQVLEMEWNRALRSGSYLSLLMIDVDHFKQINDRYGHPRGDQCLIGVARALSGHLRRGGDLLARYGGEEFVAILPEIDLGQAQSVAEALRRAVSEMPDVLLWFNGERQLTVSIGVASFRPAHDDTPATLVAAADMAMYRAKQRGRNRTEVLHMAEVASSLLSHPAHA